MTKISSRQLYFLLACIAPLGKLILLPSQLVQFSKNDLLLPALIGFLVQAAVIFCVLLLAKRNMSFYELLANTFGRIAAKILLTVFALFLFYAALLPLLEQKLFVEGVLYDTLPSIVAFSPFFVLSAYLCSKPLAAFGRTWDILAPLAIVGFAGILLLSVGTAKYDALLPVGASGVSGILQGTAFSTSWFYDAPILLALLGKIEYKKGMAWKGTLWYLAGALGVLFFLATFYGIFQETALNQPFAYARTSKYFAGITVLGRIDYLFSFLLALVLAFWISLPIQAGVDCIDQAYGRPRYLSVLLGIGINAVFFLISVLLEYRFGDILQTISQPLWWIFPIFCVGVPPLCLLLRRKRREAA